MELDNAQSKIENVDEKTETTSTESTSDSDMPAELKKADIIYEQAFKRIKDVKFIIELLNIAQEYKNTEKLQHKIVR